MRRHHSWPIAVKARRAIRCRNDEKVHTVNKPTVESREGDEKVLKRGQQQEEGR